MRKAFKKGEIVYYKDQPRCPDTRIRLVYPVSHTKSLWKAEFLDTAINRTGYVNVYTHEIEHVWE